MKEQEQQYSKRSAFVRMAVGAAVSIAVCSLAAWWGSHRPQGEGAGQWYSIIPPLIAIILAFVTRRVILSLSLAVLLGGVFSVWTGNLSDPLIEHDFRRIVRYLNDAEWKPLNEEELAERGPVLALLNVPYQAFRDPTNIQILIFVPLMFAMVLIIADARGFDGIINYISRFVKGRKSAQLSTATAGVLYFFDDYSNAMVVGSAMQPLTDRYRISREKLAFLVDSTSAPIASLALISTWILQEVSYFRDAATVMGIDNTGYSIFLDVLKYRFYCIFALALVFLHIVIARDFGPMKTAEEKAIRGESHGNKNASSTSNTPSVWIAIVPLMGLLLFNFIGLWFDGDGWGMLRGGESLFQWTYWRDVIGNAKNAILIFDFAALFGLILAILSASLFANFPLRRTLHCLWQGVKTCIGPCLILILAWSLKNCSDLLNTGEFLAALLVQNIPLVILPMIVFLVACMTSFATGTSWGTMGILIPLVGPVAYQLEGGTYGLITMMSLGAVLDGAIFGDHCSPISDTTILSSSATHCDLMQHVRTQMPYSILAAAVALLCGYVPVALGLGWLASLPLGILAITVVFFLLGTRIESTCEETE